MQISVLTEKDSVDGFVHLTELARALTSILGIESDLLWGILCGRDSWHYFRSYGLQGSILTVRIKGFWRRKWVASENNSSPYSWPGARMSERKWSPTFSTVTAPHEEWKVSSIFTVHRLGVKLVLGFVLGLALHTLITRLLLSLWWTMQ